MEKTETIAVLDLKVGRSIQLNELITLNESQRSRSFLTLGKSHVEFKIRTCFSQKQTGYLKPKFI